MLKFNEFINESSKKGYWVFEPKEGLKKRVSIKYPYPRYDKNTATEHFFQNTQNPNDFKEPYFEQENIKSTISFKEEKSDNDFINWLRDNKGYDRSDDDLQFEYSASELDYLYDEYNNYKNNF